MSLNSLPVNLALNGDEFVVGDGGSVEDVFDLAQIVLHLLERSGVDAGDSGDLVGE